MLCFGRAPLLSCALLKAGRFWSNKVYRIWKNRLVCACRLFKELVVQGIIICVVQQGIGLVKGVKHGV